MLLVTPIARKVFLAVRFYGEPATYQGGLSSAPIIEEIKVIRTVYNVCLQFSENRCQRPQTNTSKRILAAKKKVGFVQYYTLC